jgi:hypothetical protein
MPEHFYLNGGLGPDEDEDPILLHRVATTLADHGYPDARNADGNGPFAFNLPLQQAIEAFERDEGLPPTGRIAKNSPTYDAFHELVNGMPKAERLARLSFPRAFDGALGDGLEHDPKTAAEFRETMHVLGHSPKRPRDPAYALFDHDDERALRSFQAARNLPPTGRMKARDATHAALVLAVDNLLDHDKDAIANYRWREAQARRGRDGDNGTPRPQFAGFGPDDFSGFDEEADKKRPSRIPLPRPPGPDHRDHIFRFGNGKPDTPSDPPDAYFEPDDTGRAPANESPQKGDENKSDSIGIADSLEPGDREKAWTKSADPALLNQLKRMQDAAQAQSSDLFKRVLTRARELAGEDRYDAERYRSGNNNTTTGIALLDFAGHPDFDAFARHLGFNPNRLREARLIRDVTAATKDQVERHVRESVDSSEGGRKDHALKAQQGAAIDSILSSPDAATRLATMDWLLRRANAKTGWEEMLEDYSGLPASGPFRAAAKSLDSAPGLALGSRRGPGPSKTAQLSGTVSNTAIARRSNAIGRIGEEKVLARLKKEYPGPEVEFKTQVRVEGERRIMDIEVYRRGSKQPIERFEVKANSGRRSARQREIDSRLGNVTEIHVDVDVDKLDVPPERNAGEMSIRGKDIRKHFEEMRQREPWLGRSGKK